MQPVFVERIRGGRPVNPRVGLVGGKRRGRVEINADLLRPRRVCRQQQRKRDRYPVPHATLPSRGWSKGPAAASCGDECTIVGSCWRQTVMRDMEFVT